MSRTILHLDLDAFYCSVEELHNPALRGTPFAVGGRPEARGVVASCSYPARKFGIRSAMPTSQALRLCPMLKILPPHFQEYSRISEQVMDLLRQSTPLIEQVSIDEAFLEISDLSETGEVVARMIQKRINQEIGLPCSIGVASNKLVAKIANDVGKSSHINDTPPNAITSVLPGSEMEFLNPLPVERLWGVGPKTARRLETLSVRTIGDLVTIPEAELVRLFGKNGRLLSLHARGIDDSPITTKHEIKSVSCETTFILDIKDAKIIDAALRELSVRVGERLRKERLSGTIVRIKIRWPNFTTITRQTKLGLSVNRDEELYLVARRLLDNNWKEGLAIRLLGVGVSGLEEEKNHQLRLWESYTQSSSNPPGQTNIRHEI